MTKPLFATVNAVDLGDYVGYQIGLGDPYGRATIAAVNLGVLAGDPVRVELVEYPGYHIDINHRYTVYAVTEPVKPALMPDLIDREGDAWCWYEGYRMSDPCLWSQAEVEKEFGPVRDD